MKCKVLLVLLVLVLIMGCSKQETQITGLTVAGGQQVSAQTTVTIQDLRGSCVDSDDGITVDRAGKVSGVLDGEEYTIYDECIAGLLVEYYCEDNNYGNQNIRCPEECSGGACTAI